VTHATEEQNQTAPTPTPSSPHRTAQGGGHQTIPWQGQGHPATPTNQPGLDSDEVIPTQVPPTATEDHYAGGDPRRPEITSKKPTSRGDRFSEDSKFITVNPGKWYWSSSGGGAHVAVNCQGKGGL
jgi:receptor-type tyrosine-protein phosphatase gamma